MKHLIILIFTGLVMSCGSGSQKTAGKTDNMENLRGKWNLIELEGETIRTDRPLYLDLSEDDKVAGFVGCNRVMGSYETRDGKKIKFDNLATTRMTCPQIELEGKVVKMFASINFYEVKDEMLLLSGEEGKPLAIFQKSEENGIVNKYWKLKTLNGQEVEMAENQEREQYMILRSDQSVDGFAGCNHFNGKYELDGHDKISFDQNMAVSLKACLDVEVDERAFLDVFSQVDQYLVDQDDLTWMDSQGDVIATFEAVYF